MWISKYLAVLILGYALSLLVLREIGSLCKGAQDGGSGERSKMLANALTARLSKSRDSSPSAATTPLDSDQERVLRAIETSMQANAKLMQRLEASEPVVTRVLLGAEEDEENQSEFFTQLLELIEKSRHHHLRRRRQHQPNATTTPTSATPPKRFKAKLPPTPDHLKLDLLNQELLPTPPPSAARIFEYFVTPVDMMRYRTRLQGWYGLKSQSIDDTRPLFDFFNASKYAYPNLFALQDEDAIKLAAHYEEMRLAGVEQCMPLDLIQVAVHKDKFNSVLLELGLAEHAPKVYASVDEFYAQEGGARFPVMIKRTDGTSSQGVYVANNASSLDFYLQRKFLRHKYMLQEYVSGREERTIHVVAIKGRIVRMICHTRMLNDAIYRYSEMWKKTPDQVDIADCAPHAIASIIKYFQFTGIGNIDTRMGSDGKLKVIEFNPRVPGTIHRDPRIFGEFICALQWNGNGILSPDQDGCEYTTGNRTLV